MNVFVCLQTAGCGYLRWTTDRLEPELEKWVKQIIDEKKDVEVKLADLEADKKICVIWLFSAVVVGFALGYLFSNALSSM